MRKSEATEVLTFTPSRVLKPASVGETAGVLCSAFPWRSGEPLRSTGVRDAVVVFDFVLCAGVGDAVGVFDFALCWGSDEPLSAAE